MVRNEANPNATQLPDDLERQCGHLRVNCTGPSSAGDRAWFLLRSLWERGAWRELLFAAALRQLLPLPVSLSFQGCSSPRCWAGDLVWDSAKLLCEIPPGQDTGPTCRKAKKKVAWVLKSPEAQRAPRRLIWCPGQPGHYLLCTASRRQPPPTCSTPASAPGPGPCSRPWWLLRGQAQPDALSNAVTLLTP